MNNIACNFVQVYNNMYKCIILIIHEYQVLSCSFPTFLRLSHTFWYIFFGLLLLYILYKCTMFWSRYLFKCFAWLMYVLVLLYKSRFNNKEKCVFYPILTSGVISVFIRLGQLFTDFPTQNFFHSDSHAIVPVVKGGRGAW